MINLFLLLTLTAAANKAVQHESALWDIAIVTIGLFSYWVSEGFVLRRMTVVVERVRLRIVEKIRYTDLTSIEMMARRRLTMPLPRTLNVSARSEWNYDCLHGARDPMLWTSPAGSNGTPEAGSITDIDDFNRSRENVGFSISLAELLQRERLCLGNTWQFMILLN